MAMIAIAQLRGLVMLISHITDHLYPFDLEFLNCLTSNRLIQLLAGLLALGVCVFLMIFGHRSRPKHTTVEKFVRKRGDSSAYPPGMQFDVVQKKWAWQGMDPPFPLQAPRT